MPGGAARAPTGGRGEGGRRPPCDCSASQQAHPTVMLESPPRSGSTLMYGVLITMFSSCSVRKDHFKLAQPHSRHKGPWAHNGPIVTTVRDPLDSVMSALLFLHQPNDLGALRVEVDDFKNVVVDGRPFDANGCTNTSSRIVFKYEHFFRSPDGLVDALEGAFSCRAAPAARETIRSTVFNVSAVRDATASPKFKYARTSRAPASGQWSAQLAGAHPKHVSDTLGGPHAIGETQKKAILANLDVRALRSACGYPPAR